MNYNKSAFTLAEVLIALVVIGIISAITMPILISSAQERAMSQRQVNIVRKVTEATNQMRAAGELTQFDTTMDFVNVLKKYLKITKICDSDHIADCWPTKKVIDQDGEEYTVSDAKLRGDLGFKTNKNVPNVGVVLADGATLIMTYDPTNKGLSLGEQLISSNIDLPVGLGKTKNFNYTTNSTSGLDFVFDVNGGKGPNSETQTGTTKLKDIRNLNKAHFGTGCSGVKIDGKCYFWSTSTPGTINCSTSSISSSTSDSDTKKYCPNVSSSDNVTADVWAGANKYCQENNAQLIDSNTLISLCNTYGSTIGNGQMPLSSGLFWSSDICYYLPASGFTYCNGAYVVNFSSCSKGGYGRANNTPVAYCVAN